MIWGERANPYKHSYLEGLQRIEVSVRLYLDRRKNSLNISRFLSCVALCMCLRLDHSCFILGHLICGKCAYYYVCTCVQGGASNQIFGGPDRKMITVRGRPYSAHAVFWPFLTAPPLACKMTSLLLNRDSSLWTHPPSPLVRAHYMDGPLKRGEFNRKHWPHNKIHMRPLHLAWASK